MSPVLALMMEEIILKYVNQSKLKCFVNKQISVRFPDYFPKGRRTLSMA